MHEITKTIVRGPAGSVLRATCSCNGLLVDAARLSTASRRRQERMIREHLASATANPAAVGTLLAASAIEASP